MPKTAAGAALLLLALIGFNAWRQGGAYALRSWLSSIFLNRPLPRPTAA